jgi:hypothetical protein
MALVAATVYKYACEPAAAQGPEVRMPHPCDGLIVAQLPTSVFLGDGWADVYPIPSLEAQSALFLWIIQRAADIGSASIFLETVRDTEGMVVAHRVWIPMDSITLLEFQRVCADSVVTDADAPRATKKRKLADIVPPHPASGAAITTIKQIGDTFRGIYPDVSFGQSGMLNFNPTGDGSIFLLLGAERVLDASPDGTRAAQRDPGAYVAAGQFQCPGDILAEGDMRSLRIGPMQGHGIALADDLREWVRPEIRPTKKTIMAHLNGLMHASGNFTDAVDEHALCDLMPVEFPVAGRGAYDGPVFNNAVAFYAPIYVPAPDSSNQSTRSTARPHFFLIPVFIVMSFLTPGFL